MLTRQKTILRLIDEAGGTISRLRLVKLAFLLTQNGNSSHLHTFYRFVPYSHGPFSFGLYHELRKLADAGYLSTTDKEIIVQPDKFAIPGISKTLKATLNQLINRYSKYSDIALLKLVYEKYPWYTINAVKEEQRRQKRPVATCDIYTVGYERMQIDEFIDLLLRSGMQRLVDTRSNPISRRYGFHKSTLQRICELLEIEYQHVPDLGIPASWRTNLNDKADFKRLMQRYRSEVLPNEEESINRIRDWVNDGASVLLCMEEDPSKCHRSILAEHLAELTDLRIYDLRSEM